MRKFLSLLIAVLAVLVSGSLANHHYDHASIAAFLVGVAVIAGLFLLPRRKLSRRRSEASPPQPERKPPIPAAPQARLTLPAASVREEPVAAQRTGPVAVATAPRSTQSRLAELRALLGSGVITQAEHDARRAAILDEL